MLPQLLDKFHDFIYIFVWNIFHHNSYALKISLNCNCNTPRGTIQPVNPFKLYSHIDGHICRRGFFEARTNQTDNECQILSLHWPMKIWTVFLQRQIWAAMRRPNNFFPKTSRAKCALNGQLSYHSVEINRENRLNDFKYAYLVRFCAFNHGLRKKGEFGSCLHTFLENILIYGSGCPSGLCK